jgi:glutamate racemase
MMINHSARRASPVTSPSLGIMDWGIGGLGFYRLLKEERRDVPVTYWSDSGMTPYGKLPAAQLAARVRTVATALAARGVTHLVVACNAASTALPAVLRDGAATSATLPLMTGVIEHGIRAARRMRARRIGVVGGRRTILSGAYRRGLSGDGRIIRQRIAQPLSARIEAGDTSSPALARELQRIMRPLRNVEALILACTHYPAIAPQFQALAPAARLIDPVEALLSWIESHWELPRGKQPDIFLTTGEPDAMRIAAHNAFEVRLTGIIRVSL